MVGFITIERKLWDHPLFKPEPMTEREAWIWMIAQAAWSDTRHRVGNELVAVPRGSFMATLREMQSAFMWRSDKRVRTFLNTLEKCEMIGRTKVGTKNASKTHVSICKYEEYQSRGRTKDAPKTHDRTHDGRTTDAVKEQDNKITIEGDTKVSPVSPQPIDDTSAAIRAYNDCAKECGWPTMQKITKPRSAKLKARLRDCGGIDGWCSAIERAAASQFLTGQTSRPFFASFDWITTESNFTKIMEGNYDNRSGSANGPNGSGTLEQIAKAAAVDQASGLDWHTG